jgi:hypothetical protein
MGSKNYIPNRETEFNAWLPNFVTVASANSGVLNLSPAQVTALTTLMDTYTGAFTEHVTQQAVARAQREAKDEARRAVIADIRPMVRVIQANKAISDVLREQLGITIPKTDKTPAPVPTTSPIAQVEDIESFIHILRITDSVSNKTAKPNGVDGLEIWQKIVPAGQAAPTDPDELAFAGFATTSKITRDFDASDAGKMVYYRSRWVNTTGKTGPWGPQVGATIAA